MPTKDRILTLIEELNEVKRQLRELQTRQRNIDWVVLRDGVSEPTATVGLGFLYIDIADGLVKIIDGDGNVTVLGVTPVFLALSDTPSSYTSHAGKVVRVNATPNGLEFVNYNFLELSDTPTAYTGHSGKFVVVKGAADGLEFAAFVTATAGIADAGKPIKLDNDGYLDASLFGGFAPDHGGLPGLVPDDDHSQYALLAGRSGGQSFVGGTAASNSLTLRSTTHGTKGPVIIADDGGFIGLGTASPNAKVHMVDTGVPARMERIFGSSTLSAAVSLKMTSAGNMTDGFGPAFLFEINDDTLSGLNVIGRVGAIRSGADNSGALVIHTTNAGTESEKLRVNPSGRIGHGTTSPQLWHHSHDGTTGHAWGTVSIPSGTAVTVIPDAAGDVVARLTGYLILRPNTGTTQNSSGLLSLSPGDSTIVYSSGSDQVTLAVTAGGAVTLQRTGGTLTYTVSLNLFWQ